MLQNLSEMIGQTDIYLIDQIVKGRYKQEDRILDAGCGQGRNMHWFVQNNITIVGTDADATALAAASAQFPNVECAHFALAPCDALPFQNDYFDHIICSAVLHFAVSEQHFMKMMEELIRVMRPDGTLFIRMASIFGMEQLLTIDANGHSILPDGTTRFLLTDYLLHAIMKNFNVELSAPVKTTIVHGQRCMSTVLISKSAGQKM
jgi:tellurite methyltransferase